MKNRKLERKEAIEELTRKDILDSAVTVLLDKGINHFTMDRVASDAGIAKGTIYLYFKGKNQLLDFVVDYCFFPLEENYADIAKKTCDPISKLKQFVLESMQFTENNKKILNEIRTVMFNTMDQAIGNEKSWYWNSVNLLSTVFDDAVKKRKLKPMNTTRVAVLFFNSISAFMSHRILTDVKQTIEEDAQEIMALFIEGLSV
ncbi:MAG: TetR/AcrR family transcriptional regulator [Desulfobacteraceae bacterium]|jgi:AcrR family transcriptional regulator